MALPPFQPGIRRRVGEVVAARDLTAISGQVLPVPALSGLVHLQFRRFAGCPVCDLHLRSFARRYAEIEAAGVQEVVLFHSSRKALLPYAGELPFPVVADPGRRLYAEFGVEAESRALLNPAAWPTILAAVAVSLAGILFAGRPAPPLDAEGGRLGLPADMLIGADGRILACKYGDHAGDHWSVDELLARSAVHPARRSSNCRPMIS